ncbi:uncharacterized protein BDZ99DRAFT_560336 [Mytilinidion resinicola]|uniref:Uncharacterized protein n=1 Tax=Mytilinidion resinicola TaxID=574789 RepID=A0A6A6YTF0_9PEZI|nr:uncharacterized protein BDZ99DRAFT_560336 [Mytilinidion resinicola]KAF2811848.1 hypothetical protein BDZ99DRAFT_560336 [Mytilinidion resinicola]
MAGVRCEQPGSARVKRPRTPRAALRPVLGVDDAVGSPKRAAKQRALGRSDGATQAPPPRRAGPCRSLWPLLAGRGAGEQAGVRKAAPLGVHKCRLGTSSAGHSTAPAARASNVSSARLAWPAIVDGVILRSCERGCACQGRSVYKLLPAARTCAVQVRQGCITPNLCHRVACAPIIVLHRARRARRAARRAAGPFPLASPVRLSPASYQCCSHPPAPCRDVLSTPAGWGAASCYFETIPRRTGHRRGARACNGSCRDVRHDRLGKTRAHPNLCSLLCLFLTTLYVSMQQPAATTRWHTAH